MRAAAATRAERRRTRGAALAVLALLTGCGSGATASANGAGSDAPPLAEAKPAPAAPVLAPGPAPAGTAMLYDERGADGAQMVVRQAAQALRERRYADVTPLLSPTLRARLRREGGLKRLAARYPGIQVEAGRPGAIEGAAGSSYVTVPVELVRTGEPMAKRRYGSVTLRRVNDVPGATAGQLRWRIEAVRLERARGG